MSFNDQNLPFAENHLEPAISEKTVEFHFGKHQKGYADKLVALTNGTPFANMDLVSIIKETVDNPAQTAIFNNAAQLWNHILYWDSVHAYREENPIPAGAFADAVKATFGNEDNLKAELLDAAVNLFGSGWVWLAADNKTKELKIIKTQNAANPITMDMEPLLTIDVWEHAYYLDYQNRRSDYAKGFIFHLLDWNAAAERYERLLQKK